eukprot:331033_1
MNGHDPTACPSKVNAASTEIFLLTEKIEILTKLCASQTSEYRAKQLESERNFSKTLEEYTNTNEALNLLIKNQTTTLDTLRRKLQEVTESLQSQKYKVASLMTLSDQLQKQNAQQSDKISFLSNTNRQLKVQFDTKSHALEQAHLALRHLNMQLELKPMIIPEAQRRQRTDSQSSKIPRITQFTPIPNNPITPFIESCAGGGDTPAFLVYNLSNATITSQTTDKSDTETTELTIMPINVPISTIEENTERTPADYGNAYNIAINEFVYTNTFSPPTTNTEPSIQGLSEQESTLTASTLQDADTLSPSGSTPWPNLYDDNDTGMEYEIDALFAMLSDEELFGENDEEQQQEETTSVKVIDKEAYLDLTVMAVQSKYPTLDVPRDELIQSVKHLEFDKYHEEMVHIMERKMGKQSECIKELQNQKEEHVEDATCTMLWPLFGALT